MPKKPLDPRQTWRPPPRLPITMINVRPRDGAIVYTEDGTPIPAEAWTQVPISAGVVQAIRAGDLEEGEPVNAEHDAAAYQHAEHDRV